MKKLYDKHLKKHVDKVRHHVKKHLSKVEKKHIRTSIAVALVLFGSIVTMLIVYSQNPLTVVVDGTPIDVELTTGTKIFSIISVSVFLAAILGTIEYLYITRVKGY
ncbi:MAG: hypothetical protein ACLFPQ_05790 [Candidatus Woesearchaeota archaeon]